MNHDARARLHDLIDDISSQASDLKKNHPGVEIAPDLRQLSGVDVLALRMSEVLQNIADAIRVILEASP